jgi:hypothetical protein
MYTVMNIHIPLRQMMPWSRDKLPAAQGGHPILEQRWQILKGSINYK